MDCVVAEPVIGPLFARSRCHLAMTKQNVQAAMLVACAVLAVADIDSFTFAPPP